jgi:hypothetical protein
MVVNTVSGLIMRVVMIVAIKSQCTLGTCAEKRAVFWR